MNHALKRKVLVCFKQLHQARQVAFQGDEVALTAARVQINEEFTKNKHVSRSEVIEELVKYGQQVEGILRKHVLRAVKIDDDKYRAEIHQDTVMMDNYSYRDMPDDKIGPFRRKKKCGDPEGKGN